MRWFRRLQALLSNVLHPHGRDRDVTEELAAYRDLLAEEKLRQGMTPAQARRAARLEAGSLEHAGAAVRDARAGALLNELLRDVRYAFRTLRRSPAFTVAAVMALGLGFGVSGAVFSVVEAVLLRPLPYAAPERLVVLLHGGTDPVSPANFLDWRRGTAAFAGLEAAEAWSANVEGAEGTEQVRGLRITPGMLELLGVEPMLGSMADDPAERTLVLSHDLWQTRFGGRRDLLMRTVRLDGEAYTITGVMGPAFRFAPFWVTDAAMWTPLDLAPRSDSRDGSSLRIFGRLAEGTSMDAARAEVAAVTGALEARFPGTNRDVLVTPLRDTVTGDVRPVMLLLLGAVMLVLVMACANVAHLLLARAAARTQESAVRTAIGASRARLVRQYLVESLVLCFLAALAGTLLTTLGARALVVLAPADIPGMAGAGLNTTVVAFLAGVACLTALVFGLAPTLGRGVGDVSGALRDGGRGFVGGRHHTRVRRTLLAAEFALALMLLVSAGLLLRSFAALMDVDPGLRTDRVVSMELSVRGSAHAEPAARAAYYADVLARVRALPGVQAAGLVNHLPLAGDIWGSSYTVEGAPPLPAGERLGAV